MVQLWCSGIWCTLVHDTHYTVLVVNHYHDWSCLAPIEMVSTHDMTSTPYIQIQKKVAIKKDIMYLHSPEWQNWSNLAEDFLQLLFSDFIWDVPHCQEEGWNKNIRPMKQFLRLFANWGLRTFQQLRSFRTQSSYKEAAPKNTPVLHPSMKLGVQ